MTTETDDEGFTTVHQSAAFAGAGAGGVVRGIPEEPAIEGLPSSPSAAFREGWRMAWADAHSEVEREPGTGWKLSDEARSQIEEVQRAHLPLPTEREISLERRVRMWSECFAEITAFAIPRYGDEDDPDAVTSYIISAAPLHSAAGKTGEQSFDVGRHIAEALDAKRKAEAERDEVLGKVVALRGRVAELEGAKVLPERLTRAQIDDACLSYRHDFGLMGAAQAQYHRREAEEWWKVIRRALTNGGDDE